VTSTGHEHRANGPAPSWSRVDEVLIVGSAANRTNVALVESWRNHGILATLIDAEGAERVARHGDVVLGRLDVLPTLDGVERGLLALLELERRGIRVLNGAGSLLAVHDKLLTARALAQAGLPLPPTAAWSGEMEPPLEPPVVVKPRFGSWGRDVLRCADRAELARVHDGIRDKRWFRRHGAVLQALVPPAGHDLRLLVAGSRVVGAAMRVAAPGEWRTNMSLGAALRPASPEASACALALAAAATVGADLVGVDLLPVDDGYVVLELNGAVDFDHRYAIDGTDPYLEAAAALGLPAAQAPCDAPVRSRRKNTTQ